MEQIKKDGLARSIGVSMSLEEIHPVCDIRSVINQLEFNRYSVAHYLPTLLPLWKVHNV
ncbi:hypothetical protein I310_02580 [Cryptococcus deuterogattii CA1014]|nr:hypothetical protein I310_02580 [Cryptococcus deuterogattii CA1014]